MGEIGFESWDAKIDDVLALNREREISRLRLVFEDYGGFVSAQVHGNVSAYYLVVQELLKHLVSGAFTCDVTLSTNEQRKLQVSTRYVLEDGKDISSMFFQD